jgi:hypothetical protein
MWLVALTVSIGLLVGGCTQPTGPAWTFVPATPTPSTAPGPSGTAVPPASVVPSPSAVAPPSGTPGSSSIPSASAPAGATPAPSPSAAPSTGPGAGLPQGSDPVTLDPANFVAIVDNPYWPLPAGATWSYVETAADGTEQDISIEVLAETREILGIAATIVHDQVTEDGELVEDTFDWYAQDAAGNVWYLGEDTKEYANGEVSSTEGSWEAGVDGAQPGDEMPAAPETGQAYRQEYLAGEAEDIAKIIAVGELVALPGESYSDVVVTREVTSLEPDLLEYKFYAPGVGLVLETGLSPELTRAELTEYALP